MLAIIEYMHREWDGTVTADLSAHSLLRLVYIMTRLKPTTKLSDIRVNGRYSVLRMKLQLAFKRGQPGWKEAFEKLGPTAFNDELITEVARTCSSFNDLWLQPPRAEGKAKAKGAGRARSSADGSMRQFVLPPAQPPQAATGNGSPSPAPVATDGDAGRIAASADGDSGRVADPVAADQAQGPGNAGRVDDDVANAKAKAMSVPVPQRALTRQASLGHQPPPPPLVPPALTRQSSLGHPPPPPAQATPPTLSPLQAGSMALAQGQGAPSPNTAGLVSGTTTKAASFAQPPVPSKAPPPTPGSVSPINDNDAEEAVDDQAPPNDDQEALPNEEPKICLFCQQEMNFQEEAGGGCA